MLTVNANKEDRVNVNDPTLIALVNKLQDVFTTVGVCHLLRTIAIASWLQWNLTVLQLGPKSHRLASDRRRRLPVERKEFGAGKYRGKRLVSMINSPGTVEPATDG